VAAGPRAPVRPPVGGQGDLPPRRRRRLGAQAGQAPPVLGLAALAQAVAGSGNGLEVVATDTLVQRSVPPSHRGRVFGVVSAATLLGGAVARGLGGILLDLTSARATFVIGGSGVLLVTLVAVGLFRGAGWGPVDA